ncbi:hypothetical protein CLW00_103146 [Mongoliibacter ruber]|uniref:F5/8 type C domain-containing protein n=1 Tax=Mongoliibacter ruber TaxID=1750599 RepID=A0A2T0WQQ1_9BACT|nr:hypothetical protein CLW00_103146 [Mongoliibacter ruber]
MIIRNHATNQLNEGYWQTDTNRYWIFIDIGSKSQVISII